MSNPVSHPRRGSRPVVVALPVALVLALGGCSASSGTPTSELGPRLQPATSLEETPAFTPAATATVVAAGAQDKPSTGGMTLAPTGSGRLDGKVIALDPGHNTVPIHSINQKNVKYYGAGWRPCQNEGSTGLDKKTPESTLVWQIAMKAAPILLAEGATVVISRPDDEGTGPCNDERAEIANRAGADLLLSIHGDGNENATSRGFFVIYSQKMLGGEAAQAASKAAAKSMVSDLTMNMTIPVSNYIGSAHDGTIEKSTSLGVLNTMRTGPAIMVEVGNIIQADDWAILSTDAGQEEVGRAIAIGAANIVLSTPDIKAAPSAAVTSP